MTKKNRLWISKSPPKLTTKQKNFRFFSFFWKKIQRHVWVIGWSYRYQNTSKGFGEQVETILDQFWKKFFSEILIENRAFFAIFFLIFALKNHILPKMDNYGHFLPTEVFFSKTSTNSWNFGGSSVFLRFVVIFLSLFKKK